WRGAGRETASRSRLYRALEAPGLSARPRDKPPHVALGPARACLDAEARGLDAALGLAVPVASAAEARPQRLPAVLHARFEATGRAHVLEHPQRAARPQPALYPGQAAPGA